MRRKLPPGQLRKGSKQHQVWRIVNSYAEARYRVGTTQGAPFDNPRRDAAIADATRLQPIVQRALLATTADEVNALVLEAGLSIDGWVA